MTVYSTSIHVGNTNISATCVACVSRDRSTIVGDQSIPARVKLTDGGPTCGQPMGEMEMKNVAYDLRPLLDLPFSSDDVQRIVKSKCPCQIAKSPNADRAMIGQNKVQPRFLELEQLYRVLFKQVTSSWADPDQYVLVVPVDLRRESRERIAAALDCDWSIPVHMISEPEAAVYAYGLQNEEQKKILLVTMGGSKYEVDLMEVSRGYINVLATYKDHRCTGRNIDESLRDHLIQQPHINKRIKQDDRSSMRLLLLCRNIKHQLSYKANYRECIRDLETEDSTPVKISRNQFDMLNKDRFEAAIEATTGLLRDHNVQKESIHYIILAGGGLNDPKLQQLLRDAFRGCTIKSKIDVDKVFVRGGIEYGLVVHKPKPKLTHLPFTIGIEQDGGEVRSVVPWNTPIPSEHQVTVRQKIDPKSGIQINLYKGERVLTRDNILLHQITEEVENLEFKDGCIGPADRRSLKFDRQQYVTLFVNIDENCGIKLFLSTANTESNIEKLTLRCIPERDVFSCFSSGDHSQLKASLHVEEDCRQRMRCRAYRVAQEKLRKWRRDPQYNGARSAIDATIDWFDQHPFAEEVDWEVQLNKLRSRFNHRGRCFARIFKNVL